MTSAQFRLDGRVPPDCNVLIEDVQARGHLESMMRRQLELRREETKVMHE